VFDVSQNRTGIEEAEKAAPATVFDSALEGDAPSVAERDGQRRPAASWIKRGLDLFIALGVLILSAPIMAVIAVMIVLSDGGSPIFVQSRYGRDGKPFRFYKFRSMALDADAQLEAMLADDPSAASQWQSRRKLQSDPRITSLGQFIRQWSLDELPQLINIIRGEMSVVGPRPLVRADADTLDDRALYGVDFDFYRMARPGVTGLWQVSGRASTTFAERVAFDVRYVSGWSHIADFKILMKTIPAVLLRRGAL
jgi:lipopolysaccharide/colanic/teichoic acid biosynthesis glycosyltransferase